MGHLPDLQNSYDNIKYDTLNSDQDARLRVSGFNEIEMSSLDIKYASCTYDLEKIFSLVYESYLKRGLVPEEKDHGMLFSVYSLLPGTVHAVASDHQKAVSNLTGIQSSEEFGLPMDALYRPELDILRDRGRSIVEISSLATSCQFRNKKIFLYQIQAIYWYCLYHGVDDICIMVHPRHKKFYTKLFPFEAFGPERYYSKVNAPAVGLRANVYKSLQCMMDLCNRLPSKIPLYDYIYKLTSNTYKRYKEYRQAGNFQLMLLHNNLSGKAVNYFLNLEPGIVKGFNNSQLSFLQKVYPELALENS